MLPLAPVQASKGRPSVVIPNHQRNCQKGGTGLDSLTDSFRVWYDEHEKIQERGWRKTGGWDIAEGLELAIGNLCVATEGCCNSLLTVLPTCALAPLNMHALNGSVRCVSACLMGLFSPESLQRCQSNYWRFGAWLCSSTMDHDLLIHQSSST